ncbi:MAG: SpoIIE family protein phosphatase [Pseudobdellovibrionaceae bacterium]
MNKEKTTEQKLRSEIEELQEELAQKNLELQKYRVELQKTNSTLEKIISDLSQELRLASLIQKLLSPTEIPNIPGIEFSTKFIPGHKSGGDYFDIFEHDDRLKFGVILASSSGYTMSALFLSVLMKLSAQIEARKGMDPDKVITLMAQEIVPHIQRQDTASIFYGVVDRRNYELKYCNVGSIAGLLQVHGKDQPSWLEPTTGPLGKEYDGKPLTHSIPLGARDRLILCTEGIWKASSPDQEIFGRDRISKTILRAPRSGVHELRNEILFQVEKFIQSEEPDRDQTVIVTEVKDRVIKLAKKGSS